MNKRLVLGAFAAFVVIFNLGYVFHEVVAAPLLAAGMGPGVQRASYIIPVIAAAFAGYVTMLALAYPVAHLYFVDKHGWSRVTAGALLGLFCGVLWDFFQGGIIEYATYNVTLSAMLVDSTYHAFEGVIAGAIIGASFKQRRGSV